ncbi:ISNCY family transposase, partial [Klebsiella pneumoniae]
ILVARLRVRSVPRLINPTVDKEMVQKITGLSADELQPLCG